jgi:aspartate ammonia-lyase
MRTERDFLGECEIPIDALYGIHSFRARENFPDKTPFQLEWYKAVGLVKLACYETYKSYKSALLSKFGISKIPVQLFSDEIIEALIASAVEVSQGKYFEWFIVPAVQGGAGTSINMNINEIIANASLIKLGRNPGDYNYIDPIEHANIFQSTNDVVPTSLKLTIIQLLAVLEEKINLLRAEIEKIEKQYRNSLRIGYTQMQEAVPTSFGRLFSTYNDALSRDWWRISKCFERIKIVNLGGSAIGTGITVPRFFIMEVVQNLQRLCDKPLTRSENLSDATSNLDSLVEVHAVIKANAVNLEKIANDLRLLSSDLTNKEISIPQKQAGSSVMPGKVNPVIPEFVISAAHKIYANDNLITSFCGQGCLELNAYIPLIGHVFIESLKLLVAANETTSKNLISGLIVNDSSAEKQLFLSASITTALVPYIGYHKASELAILMKTERIDIFEANEKLNFIDKKKLSTLLKPEYLLKEGFTIDDINVGFNEK